MALEQPAIPWLLFTNAGLFSDPAYLDRYGFIPDTIIPGQGRAFRSGSRRAARCSIPSGAPWRNPRTKQDMIGVGLTCAACHTGSFTYKDTAVVIDGGPALTDLFTLKQGMGVSLLCTRFWPGRFGRFAEKSWDRTRRVDDRATLKDQIDQVLTQYKEVKDLEERRRFPEHPGRLRTARRAEPDRQPGVFARPEEAGKLRGLLGAGALPADLEHAVVRLGAV